MDAYSFQPPPPVTTVEDLMRYSTEKLAELERELPIQAAIRPVLAEALKRRRRNQALDGYIELSSLSCAVAVNLATAAAEARHQVLARIIERARYAWVARNYDFLAGNNDPAVLWD